MVTARYSSHCGHSGLSPMPKLPTSCGDRVARCHLCAVYDAEVAFARQATVISGQLCPRPSSPGHRPRTRRVPARRICSLAGTSKPSAWTAIQQANGLVAALALLFDVGVGPVVDDAPLAAVHPSAPGVEEDEG